MREIPLSRGLGARVDEEDFEMLSAYKWYAKPARQANANHYAYRMQKNSAPMNVYMHRQILGCVKGELADHIDGDGLNNLRSNLRKTDRSGNNANRRYASQSGFRGVYRRRLSSSYNFVAQITVRGVYRKIGCFRTAEMAAVAYDTAALKAFGEFAILNFPEVR